jgi:pyruvate dehydrogenase E1 component beta subunit
MATELKMPALSPTMEEGTLAKWLVKVGDSVSSGDILAEIETDKATMEFEAVDEGVVSAILVAEGTDGVKVGTVIALIKSEDEEAAPMLAAIKSAAPSVAVVVPESIAVAPTLAVNTKPVPSEYTGPMKSVTVREALRDAMAEEMRREGTVFVMGEEVAEYQGAYKVTQGLLEEFGADRVIDTPISDGRIASRYRVYDFQFCDASD